MHLREEDAEGVIKEDHGMMITAKMRDKLARKDNVLRK